MLIKVLQIESIEAADLINRLDRIESAITAIMTDRQISMVSEVTSDYITRRDVATMFRITLTTVHDWTRKGILQAYKIGHRVYYKKSEIEGALTKKK